MRIGVHLLSLRPGQVGGQEVFIRRLLEHAVPMIGADRLVILGRPELMAAWGLRGRAVEFIAAEPERHYGPEYRDWSLRLIEQARLDVVYFPLFFFFPRPLPIPVAVHVPDLQHEFFPENFAPEQLAWRQERIPESVQLADLVITYSRCTADSVEARLGADPGKVQVIYAGGFTAAELHGAERAAGHPAAAAAVLLSRTPLIFYPAADWPHKNHEVLLRAAGLLAQRGVGFELVLSGQIAARGDGLRRLAGELGIGGRTHFLGCVPTATLIELYRRAAVMAFPSRFEGFGLPLVEAMQLGCPVVASHADAVVETAGGAALHCGDDPHAWAEALAGVLTEPSRARELRQRGIRRATDFDWFTCAAEHLALLRRIGALRAVLAPA